MRRLLVIHIDKPLYNLTLNLTINNYNSFSLSSTTSEGTVDNTLERSVNNTLERSVNNNNSIDSSCSEESESLGKFKDSDRKNL